MTLACIRVGAAACISQATSPAALADVVRRVYAGEVVYEQRILLELVQRQSTVAPDRPRRATAVSERELEVLAVLATGASSSEAADRLCISLNTVRTHLKNIMVKLEARSKLEAVMIAIRAGWIELPPE
jgi:DNA-binding NarL/FixJ family response regulator